VVTYVCIAKTRQSRIIDEQVCSKASRVILFWGISLKNRPSVKIWRYWDVLWSIRELNKLASAICQQIVLATSEVFYCELTLYDSLERFLGYNLINNLLVSKHFLEQVL
jgi:hypothetical protein